MRMPKTVSRRYWLSSLAVLVFASALWFSIRLFRSPIEPPSRAAQSYMQAMFDGDARRAEGILIPDPKVSLGLTQEQLDRLFSVFFRRWLQLYKLIRFSNIDFPSGFGCAVAELSDRAGHQVIWRLSGRATPEGTKVTLAEMIGSVWSLT